MTLTEAAEAELGEAEVAASGGSLDGEPKVAETGGHSLDRAVRVAPYAAVWIVLLLPTLRTMARGWRPVGDNATIALQSWNTFSLHVPLVGQGTGAASGVGGGQSASNPGPLEYWLLAPFVHIDPGQGALIGSAVLCAAALSLGLYVLQKSVGPWAAVVLALVVADLAIVTPFAFVDPVWSPDFASFWFLSFLAVAFAVGSGNLRYLPLLVFIGSVTIDSHLTFAPSTALVLIAVVVCGLLLQRPDSYRWLWWTVGVAAVCWIAPLGQQLFGSHPNFTALLGSLGAGSGRSVKTFGTGLGLHALARAASPKAVWATPRPIQPGEAYRDVLNGGHLVYCFVFFALVAVFVLAWRHKKTYLLSLSAVTTASAIGLVFLFARVPEELHRLLRMGQPSRLDRGDLHLDHRRLRRRELGTESPLGGTGEQGPEESGEDLRARVDRDRRDCWHGRGDGPLQRERATLGRRRLAARADRGQARRNVHSPVRRGNKRPLLRAELHPALPRRAWHGLSAADSRLGPRLAHTKRRSAPLPDPSQNARRRVRRASEGPDGLRALPRLLTLRDPPSEELQTCCSQRLAGYNTWKEFGRQVHKTDQHQGHFSWGVPVSCDLRPLCVTRER